MSNIPIRFGSRGGLVRTARDQLDPGLSELDNVDLQLDNVIQKRPGAVGVSLQRSGDPTDLIPSGETRAIWYRNEELLVETDTELYTQIKCSPGAGDEIQGGTATEEEIAFARARLEDRVAPIKTFTNTITGDPIAANAARDRLDRTYTPPKVAVINIPQPDPTPDIVWTITIASSGSKLTWTATKPGTTIGPNVLPGAGDSQRHPRLYLPLGVASDAICLYLDNDGDGPQGKLANLRALGFQATAASVSVQILGGGVIDSLLGGFTAAHFEVTTAGNRVAYFDASPSDLVVIDADTLGNERRFSVTTRPPQPFISSSGTPYKVDCARGTGISDPVVVTWVSDNSPTVQIFAADFNDNPLFQQQILYPGVVTGTQVAAIIDPDDDSEFVIAVRRSDTDLDAVFKSTVADPRPIVYDLNGEDLIYEISLVSTEFAQFLYTPTNKAVIPYLILDTTVLDYDSYFDGPAIYVATVTSSDRIVEYIWDISPSPVEFNLEPGTCVGVFGSPNRVGFVTHNLGGDYTVLLRNGATDPTPRVVSFPSQPGTPLAASGPVSIAHLSDQLAEDAVVQIVSWTGTDLYSIEYNTLTGTRTFDRRDGTPDVPVYLVNTPAGSEPRQLVAFQYASTLTDIYEQDFPDLWVKVSSPFVSTPIGNWRLVGPWTRTTLAIDPVITFGGGTVATTVDGTEIVTEDGVACSFVASDVPGQGVVAVTFSDHQEGTTVIDASGSSPRVSRYGPARAAVTYFDVANFLQYAIWTPTLPLQFVPTGFQSTNNIIDQVGGEVDGDPFVAWIYIIGNTLQFDIRFDSGTIITSSQATSLSSISDVSFYVASTSDGLLKLAFAAAGPRIGGNRVSYGQLTIDPLAPSIGVDFFHDVEVGDTPVAVNIGTTDSTNFYIFCEISGVGITTDTELYQALDTGTSLKVRTFFNTAIASQQGRLDSRLIGILSQYDQDRTTRGGLFGYDPRTNEIVSRASIAQAEILVQRNVRHLKVSLDASELGDRFVFFWGIARRIFDSATPGINKYSLVVDPPGARPPVLDGVVIAAHGGYPRAYDGEIAYEHDWHELPTIRNITTQPGASAGPGTVRVAVTFEDLDARGLTYRSRPTFDVIELAVAANVELEIYNPQFYERRNVQIVVWRTLPNGTIYYRTPGVTPTSSEFVTTELVVTDADLTDNEQLDQVPGAVVASEAVPITGFTSVANGRIWGRDPERKFLARYTIPRREGFAPHWNLAQGLEHPSQRSITAISELDGQVVVFSEIDAAVIRGDGPSASGIGAFASPALQSVSAGALNNNAIAVTPDGILYGSQQGLSLFSRSLQSVLVSADVAKFYELDGEIVNTLAYRADVATVYVANSQTSLRFHVDTARWARDTGRNAKDLTVSGNGSAAILTKDGRVLLEAPDVFTDLDIGYQTILATSWIREPSADSLSHPHFNVHSFTVFGTWLSSHTLRCEIYLNYDDSAPVYRFIIPEEALTANAAAGRPYIYRGLVGIDCYAVKIVIRDSSDQQATFRLEGIDLDLRGDGSTDPVGLPSTNLMLAE
jgi:hypothetical protein